MSFCSCAIKSCHPYVPTVLTVNLPKTCILTDANAFIPMKAGLELLFHIWAHNVCWGLLWVFFFPFFIFAWSVELYNS